LLGSPGEALSSYDRALGIYEQLAREEPQNTEYRICSATVYANRGVTLAALGRQAEASRSDQLAADGYRALHRALPTRPEFSYRLGMILSNWGELCRSGGQLETAQSCLHEAQALFGQLLREFPDHPDYQAGQARLQVNRGVVCVMLGKEVEACQAFE